MKASPGFRPVFVGICVGLTIAFFVTSEPWPAPGVIWALVVGGVALGLASICVLAWTRPTRRVASSSHRDDLRSRFTQAGIFATVAANNGILVHRGGYPTQVWPGQVWVAAALLIGAIAIAVVALVQMRRTARAGARSTTRRTPAAGNHTAS